MTENEVRGYLESHFYASKKIKALEEERKQLRLNAAGGTISFEDSGTGSKSTGTECKLMSLADDERELDEQISGLRDLQREVRASIASLHDNDLESVLIYRYIAYLTEEETAEGLNYAQRTVQEKIKKAIKKLCAKMC